MPNASHSSPTPKHPITTQAQAVRPRGRLEVLSWAGAGGLDDDETGAGSKGAFESRSESSAAWSCGAGPILLSVGERSAGDVGARRRCSSSDLGARRARSDRLAQASLST